MTKFRLAFSTLAFPGTSLASALDQGRAWGYDGVELRLVDGELIDPDMPAAQRAQVGRTLTAAVWDSHHPFRLGESAADVYAALAPRILLAQVKDARRAPERPDGWQLVLLGHGEVPVREMLALLASGGYQNWVSVEWEKRWHPEIEEPQVALPQHLAVLRSWQDGGHPEAARQEES